MSSIIGCCMNRLERTSKTQCFGLYECRELIDLPCPSVLTVKVDKVRIYIYIYIYIYIHLYDIYHCCVYSEKLLMMDRGTVRNMYRFIPKIKFEKLVQLVGFIIRNLSRCTVT